MTTKSLSYHTVVNIMATIIIVAGSIHNNISIYQMYENYSLDEMKAHVMPYVDYFSPTAATTEPSPSYHASITQAEAAGKQEEATTEKEADAIKTILQQYTSRYHRTPPRYLDRWIAYAVLHNCSIDFATYDQIDIDLAPYRSSNISRHKFEGMKAMPFVDLIELELGDYISKNYQHNRLTEPLLVSVLHLGIALDVLPKKYFAFFITWGDEPRSVEADLHPARRSASDHHPLHHPHHLHNHPQQQSNNESTPLLQKHYNHPHELLKYSSCFQQLYQHQRNPHDNTSLSSWHPKVSSILMADYVTAISTERLPIFVDCKQPCYGDIIIPRTEYRSYNSMEVEGLQLIPWRNKTSTVYFRGGSGAFKINLQKILKQDFANLTTAEKEVLREEYNHYVNNLTRIQLLRWSKHISRLAMNDSSLLLPFAVDVNVTTSGYDFDGNTMHDLTGEDTAIKTKTASYQDQIRHKYIIVPDGITWPSRLRRFLSFGSLVLYDTIFTTWSSRMTKPFVHYIPVAVEQKLETFTEVMFWVTKHDQEVEKIAKAGQEFAINHMRNVDMEVYTLLAFMEYAELCEFTEW